MLSDGRYGVVFHSSEAIEPVHRHFRGKTFLGDVQENRRRRYGYSRY
jgi:hypothetical protein